MSYTVIITEEIAANVDVTTQNYPITIEYNATNIADGGGSYGNSNVSAFLASGTDTSNIITTGNVQGAYVIGNGSALSNIAGANVTGTVPLAQYVTQAAQANITSVGTLTSLAVIGNITGGNIVSAGQGNIDNILTDAVVFDTTAAETTAAAKLNWSSAYGTMSHGLGDGSLLLDGMDLVIYATNGEANTLSKGEVVYISGASGDRAEIKRAAATDDTVSATTIGVVKNNIASGAAGYVTTQGVVDGLNLGAFTPGQTVWLSATPGQFTATQPSAPTHTVFIGVIERANAGNGRLLVRVNNGWEIGELHDVKITSPANNQYLKYSVSAGNIWVNDALDISNDTSPTLGGNLASSTYNISGTGNVTAGYFVGNGSTLTNLTAANVTGTVANATYATSAGSATTASTVTGNAQANITSVGTLSNLSVTGNVTSSANIQGAYILGNGSQLTGLPSGYGDSNVATFLAAYGSNTISTTGNITAGYFIGNGSQLTGLPSGYSNADVSTYLASGTNSANIVTTANVRGANLVASANLTSTQQTVVGTANVGTTGNIVISGKNIATDMAFSPDGGNAATAATSRVVIGTGWAGNITHSSQQNRLAVSESFNRTNTGTSVRVSTAEAFINLTGNVTNGGTRNQALGGQLRIGGGAAANTISLNQGAGNIFSVAGGQFNLDVGNISPYNLGNTTLSHVALNGGALQIQGGSTVLNAYGINNLVTSPQGGSAGNIGNIIGYSTGMLLGSVPTGNVYGFYHGSNSTAGTTGVGVVNQIRQAPQYYAFYNADDHAHVQAGSLRAYHEYRGDLGTTGTVNIDKANGQTQYIRPTGNVTIGSFSNFVTETTDGSTYDQHIDTVTIVIAQGATPYTITMPTGNAQIKYAGNISTLANTANAVTMISVSAANIASTKTYMVTISPEFT